MEEYLMVLIKQSQDQASRPAQLSPYIASVQYGIDIKKRHPVKPIEPSMATESVITSAKSVIVEHIEVIKALVSR